MNTSNTSEEITPAPSQEMVSSEFEKMPPKLNLPPKPVLVSSVQPAAPVEIGAGPSLEEAIKAPTPPAFPLLSSAPKVGVISLPAQDKELPKKKKFSIGLPLALLTILLALAAFVMQLRMMLVY